MSEQEAKSVWETSPPSKYEIEDSDFRAENHQSAQYWRKLLFISHFLNRAGSYDALTGNFVPQPLCEILEAIDTEFERDVVCFEDQIYRTCHRTLRELKDILQDSRRKPLRRHVVRPIHKVREMDTRCMTWLALQPGRTMREKLGAKQRALTVERHSSYDVLENQVVVRFASDFRKLLGNRLKWLDSANSPEIAELKKYLEELRAISDGPLRNVKRCLALRPNNVLLSDRRYNRIWRAVHWLKDYETEIQNLWISGEARLTNLVALRIVALLHALESTVVFDRFGTIEPGFDKPYSGVQTTQPADRTGESTIEVVGNLSCVIGTKAIAVLQVQWNEDTIVILENQLHGKYVLVPQYEGRVVLLKIGIQFDDSKGDFLCKANCNNRDGKTTFASHEPINCGGINKIATRALAPFLGKYGREKVAVQRAVDDIHPSAAGCNFSSAAPVVCSAKGPVKSPIRLWSCRLPMGNTLGWLDGRSNRTANLWESRKVVSLYDYWMSNDRKQLPHFVSRIIRKLSQHHAWNSLTDIAVGFPDSLDEITEAEFRDAFGGQFKAIHLPRRSACLLLGLQTTEQYKKLQAGAGTAVIVLDSEPCEFTHSCLIARNDPALADYSHSRGIFWERSPLHFDLTPEIDLSFFGFQSNYCKTFMDKFFKAELSPSQCTKAVHFLTHTGKAESIILEKQPCWIPHPDDDGRWLKIEYDERIIRHLSNRWSAAFTAYFRSLKKQVKPDELVGSSKVKNVKFTLWGRMFEIQYLRNKLRDAHGDLKIVNQKVDHVSIGADSYLDRMGKGLKTYLDWLPDLYLKTQRTEICLSSGRHVAPGEKISFDVQSGLELPAGKDDISFPLARGSRRSQLQHHATLKAPCLPLATPVDVRLKVEYTYGSGSFRLIVLPVKPADAPFESLEVEWKRGKKGARQDRQIKNERPQIPIGNKAGDIFRKIHSEVLYCSNDNFLSNGRIANGSELASEQIFKGVVEASLPNGGLLVDIGVNHLGYLATSGDFSVGDTVYVKVLRVRKKEASTVGSVSEIAKGMLLKATVDEVGRNFCLLDLGLELPGRMRKGENEYSKGDLVFVKKRRLEENTPTQINSFSEIKKGMVLEGTVTNSHNGAHFLHVGIRESAYLPANGQSYRNGVTLLLKVVHKDVAKRQFAVREVERRQLIVVEADRYRINFRQFNIMRYKARRVRPDLVKLIGADWSTLGKDLCKRVVDDVIPFLEVNDHLSLSYLGRLCPVEYLNLVIADLDAVNDDAERQRTAYQRAGNLLATGSGPELRDHVVRRTREMHAAGQVGRLNRPLGALAMGIWGQSRFIYELNTHYPGFVEFLLGTVEERYTRMPDYIRRQQNKMKILESPEDVGRVLVPFRNNNELLFGLLMLRGEDNGLFEAGSKRMVKLAGVIENIDRMFMDHGHECRSRFHFELSQEDEDCRRREMSRFVYILNSYLRGEDISSRVRIKEIDMRDEQADD